jgi:hypothetical protein
MKVKVSINGTRLEYKLHPCNTQFDTSDFVSRTLTSLPKTKKRTRFANPLSLESSL